MLGRIIAREIGFDRDESIRTAIEQAVREELESGRTEVEAQAAIMNQWRRWQPIADLFPGIGTAEFFRASRNYLPLHEESATRKRAAVLPPLREAPLRELREVPPRGLQPVERKQPRPVRRYWMRQRNPRLTMATNVGRYDASQEPVYSAEDQAFIERVRAKGIHEITDEDVKRYRIITGQEGTSFYGQG